MHNAHDLDTYTQDVLLVELGDDGRLRLTDQSAIEGGRIADRFPQETGDGFRSLVWELVNQGITPEQYDATRRLIQTFHVRLAWNRYRDRDEYTCICVALRTRSVVMFIPSSN